ncbi:MAG: glycerate kinase [Christensenellales bacterium]|jgi:glycerate kinase
MKIIVAPDSFKGSLTAAEAARCVKRGLGLAGIADVECLPLADGGEGTVEALVAATGGAVRVSRVSGPLGEPVEARWGILGDGVTAVIEMAEASGLTLVPEGRLNPMLTSTYGTGELIREAVAAGCSRLLMGIGGSATNDGGAGMAQALGFRLLDAAGGELPRGGGSLHALDRIDVSVFDAAMYRDVSVRVACDVTNPLCGPEGASAVYGPQKGADREMVARLDANLYHFARILMRDLGADVLALPGGGAAGGLGAGLAAFLGASLEPGIDVVLETVGFDRRIQGADWIITGEGRTDGQTLFGKVPLGVARRAAAAGIPVICLSGSLGPGFGALYDHGFAALLSIAPGPGTLRDAMKNAAARLEDTARAVGGILRALARRT